MLVYFAVFLIPLLYAFSRPANGLRRDVPLLVFFIVLLLFTGLRDEVGTDWDGYQNIFEIVSQQSLAEAVSNREPSFALINKLSQFLGWDHYGVNLFCAFIFLSGVFLYARTTANAWLAIALVTPFLIFVISMSGIRQSAAIGIGLITLARWQRSSLLSKLAMIALATSIHNSAVIILAVFLLVKLDRFLWLRLLVAGLIIGFSVSTVQDTEVFARYQKLYIEENLQSGGAFFHLMLSAFPAILYLVLRRQIAAHVGRDAVVDVGVRMVLLAMPLIFISSTGVSRAALYLSFLQMWIYPAFVAAQGRMRIAATAVCAAIFVSVFLGYFSAGTHAYTYLPYRSVLF